METVVIAVAALACPLSMVVMGVMMAKGMRKPERSERPSVEDVRAEHRRLGAELERLEQTERASDKLPVAPR